MKIVCYVNKMSGGGAERVMSVLANGLLQSGNDVVLATNYKEEKEYFIDERIKRVYFHKEYQKHGKVKSLFNFISRVLKLRKVLKREKADIVISFIREVNYIALCSTLFLKTKNLISVRIDPKFAYSNKISSFIAKKIYKHTDGCAFQTTEAQEYYPKKIQRKSRVILNPISNSFFEIKDGNPCQKKTVVTCGRLEKQKNHKLLIDAFSKIADKVQDYKLIIYGVGPLFDELDRYIKEKRLENVVILAGRCQDVPNAIKNDSLFVLSSNYEGLPNALMEAMALGLPCLTTDCSGGGARMLIENEKNGVIVPRNDVEQFSLAMLDLIQNREKAIKLGLKAKNTAINFSQEKVVHEWENYIKDIVGVK